MIGEKSKGKMVSAVRSTHGHVPGEPLTEEKARKRTRGIGRKTAFASFAGLVGIGALLLFKPSIATAQEVAMSVPSGNKTEQTEKSRLTIDQFEIDLNRLEGEMKKETNTRKAELIKAMLEKMETAGQGKIVTETDTLIGVVKGSICDITYAPSSIQKMLRELGLSEENFFKSVKNGGIKSLIADMDTGSAKLSIFIDIINGSKIVGTKNNKTEINIRFYDKKDENKGYTSILSCPNGCEVFDITPFFGKAANERIQFGIYFRYIKDGIENSMISYFVYSTEQKYSNLYYFTRNKDDPDSVMSALMKYSEL